MHQAIPFAFGNVRLVVPAAAEVECRTNPTGSGYRGTRAVTASGDPCLDWLSVTNLTLSASLCEINTANVNNYCRYLENSQWRVPSCVTRGRSLLQEANEMCNIPFCSKNCSLFILQETVGSYTDLLVLEGPSHPSNGPQ